jgi:CBS domain-containing protein
MTAEDAAGLMAKYDVGAIPVVDDESLVGLVTDRDLVVRVLAAREDPGQVQLGSILTRSSSGRSSRGPTSPSPRICG